MRRSLWKVVHQKSTLKWFALLKLHAETKFLLNFTRFHVNSKNQNTWIKWGKALHWWHVSCSLLRRKVPSSENMCLNWKGNQSNLIVEFPQVIDRGDFLLLIHPLTKSMCVQRNFFHASFRHSACLSPNATSKRYTIKSLTKTINTKYPFGKF